MDVLGLLAPVIISAGVSFITAYSTVRYSISLEHRKQAVPYTTKFRDECNEVLCIVANHSVLKSIIGSNDNDKANELKANFVNASDELLRVKFPSYRPFLPKDVVVSIEEATAQFLSTIHAVSQLNFHAAAKGENPAEEEIFKEFGISSGELLNQLMTYAGEALEQSVNIAESWLETNS